MATKLAPMKPIQFETSLEKGKMKIDPAYKEISAGLSSKLQKIMKEEFSLCCIQGCCVSWCCIQLH